MSILAWNCRGLANPRAIHFLCDVITRIRPSFVFLSETKVNKNSVVKVCKRLGFAGCHSVDSQVKGGGLALLWKNECDIVVKDSCLNYIDFEVNIEQIGRWRYTGYYGCPKRDRREESWSILRELYRRSTLPWCIIGDFNDLMATEEKQGRVVHPRRLLQGFTDVVNDCQLLDLGFNGNMFTWERSRGNEGWIQERLDRGLANRQ